METHLDEISLLALCAVMVAIPAHDPFAIAGFLAALIVTCASDANAPLRISLEAAFTLCACASGAFLPFLPVAAYRLMHERWWTLRFMWALPLLTLGITDGISLAWMQPAILCATGCLLAVRDCRMDSERRGLTRAYDGIRERMLALADVETPAKDAREAHEPALFQDLTQRERAVAQLVAEGMDNREISQRLFLSEGTVRNHISAILTKKGLANRTQIAVRYYQD